MTKNKLILTSGIVKMNGNLYYLKNASKGVETEKLGNVTIPGLMFQDFGIYAEQFEDGMMIIKGTKLEYSKCSNNERQYPKIVETILDYSKSWSYFTEIQDAINNSKDNINK